MSKPKVDNISDNHWRVEDFRQRVVRKQAQQILLDHPTIIFHGTLYDMAASHVGVGIYEVYKVPHIAVGRNI